MQTVAAIFATLGGVLIVYTLTKNVSKSGSGAITALGQITGAISTITGDVTK